MHVRTWIERLADAGGESRRRLLAALDAMGPDAGTVLAALPGETALVRHGIIGEPFAAMESHWRADIGETFRRLGLPDLPPTDAPDRSRTDHSDSFRALHDEFTSVRRSEVGAIW
jgi:1,2-phenylacetyl-CoA epoxidase catalytic subunit